MTKGRPTNDPRDHRTSPWQRLWEVDTGQARLISFIPVVHICMFFKRVLCSFAGCRHMSKVAESDEQLTARYVQYFESKDIDHWWLSKVSPLQR